MNIVQCKEINIDPIDMRVPYCNTLMDLAGKDRNIILMDADLLSAAGCKPFREKFPEQVVDCGIQESNMIGVAAGLSTVGKIPFCHTFASFASRRCYDQVFLSCAYAKCNVKIIGSDPAVTAATNGGTHQGNEDMGLMCAIPGNIVIDPTDNVMCENLIRKTATLNGLSYMRLCRKPIAKIYEEGSDFEIGKAVTLREGSDITIIASGICVAEALKAYDVLKEKGISARVIDCFTWKPLDEETVIKAAKETGAVVTVENHNVVSGLGARISSVVSRNCPVPIEMLGIQDRFGEVGPVDYLVEHFGFDFESIVNASMKVYERKER